jgi:hypothetical protein
MGSARDAVVPRWGSVGVPWSRGKALAQTSQGPADRGGANASHRCASRAVTLEQEALSHGVCTFSVDGVCTMNRGPGAKGSLTSGAPCSRQGLCERKMSSRSALKPSRALLSSSPLDAIPAMRRERCDATCRCCSSMLADTNFPSLLYGAASVCTLSCCPWCSLLLHGVQAQALRAETLSRAAQ